MIIFLSEWRKACFADHFTKSHCNSKVALLMFLKTDFLFGLRFSLSQENEEGKNPSCLELDLNYTL